MTKWIVRLAGIVVASALLCAAPATAAPFTPELEADYASALAWWGVSSPPLCATVTRELEQTDFQLEGALARSTQPADPWGGPCYMTVFQDGLDLLRRDWGAGASCAIAVTIRHEVGHLLGYGHSDDPNNIMHAPAPRPECEVYAPRQPQQEAPPPEAGQGSYWDAELQAELAQLARDERRERQRRYRRQCRHLAALAFSKRPAIGCSRRD